MKYKGNYKFTFELMHIAAPDESLPGVQNFDRDLLGENTIILGFPILRRPEGYPGLELPFDTLLHYLQAPKAEIFVQDVFIKGPNRVLTLVKHTDDVFLWRLDHSLANYSLCCPDKRSRAIVYEDYSSLNHHTLEASRHILSKCADDAAPIEDPHRISEGRGLVDTKMTQPRSLTETDSADSLGLSSHKPNSPRNMGGLPAASAFQNNEATFTSSSIGSAYSGFENNARTLPLEYSERSELLSQVSNMFADSQPSPITESSEGTLDSDMFSISDSSDDIDLLDRQETIYPMLHNKFHQLLAGFRTVTKYQSAPVQGRGNSGPVASTTESAHIGNNSGLSRKRKAYQDEEDDTGGDGSQPPRPKKMKPDQGKESQESFACPFLKWNPITYSGCCVKKLSSISFVKQHLHRKHTPERYCQTCHTADFSDEDKLQSHIKIGKCTCRDRTMLDGISYQQRFQLSRKSKPKSSKEEQWYAIWQILFPEDRRPSSIYIDTDLALEMRQFRKYCESHGPAIMRGDIESDPAWQSFDITEEQRRALDRLIAQGINTLFDNWYSRNSSASTTSERQSNDSPQISRYETSTVSLVDSGVVMMGQSSSRGTNSQAFELHPALRIPPVGFASPQPATYSHPRGPLPVQEFPVALNSTDIPPFASLPFGFVAEGQEWSCGGQIGGFEATSLAMFESGFDSGPFPSLEDMLVYYPQPDQDFQDGGKSAETYGCL
ncbi:hypothetical protein L207DRAFT_639741 [Hyaloscypha variabilis F]|uniref:C2H2-type domain-containing protein n=1 Tax=Hyaloscypha variabilis (strain UAMH 11265 / GT02V1 / F) TaxID=1149755 RepID=A0A2J6R3A5_HYAVF|nr:hypothetical protein L207DRAFT_639741 [Hyaloscypha variabilis F]